MAKKINIGNGIAMKFTQRARGEETPYWQGEVVDTATKKTIAHFRNGGMGGPTDFNMVGSNEEHIANRARLIAMMRAADVCEVEDFDESHGDPLEKLAFYADMIGYDLKCGPDDFTLSDYILSVYGAFDHDRTSEEKEKRQKCKSQWQAARKKENRLSMAPKAKSAALKGKTLVRIGDAFYTYPSRDFVKIADAVKKINGVDADFEVMA